MSGPAQDEFAGFAPADPVPAPQNARSAPSSADEFSGFQAAPDAVASSNEGSQGPQALSDDDFRSGLHDRINRGDALPSIQQWIAATGRDPKAAQGLEAAVTWHHDRHLGGDSPVLAGATAPAQVAKPEIDPGGGALGSGLVGALESIPYADEISGAVSAGFNSAGNLVGLGDGKSFSDHMNDTIDQNRSMANYAWDKHPYAYGTGMVGGTLATAALGGEALKAGQLAPSMFGRAATALSADTLGAGAGRAALGGAIYGSDVDNGSLGDRATGAVEGAGLGAGLGYLGSKAGRALAALAPTKAAAAGRQVLDAADRLSRDSVVVQPLPADVGGKLTRMATGTFNQGLASGPLIGKAAQSYAEGITNAANRAADSLRPGSAGASDLEDVARSVAGPSGLGGYEQSAKTANDALYGTAEQLAGNTRIITPQTVNTLDQHIAELEAVPGSVPGLAKLKGLRDDLVNGVHTIGSLRQLRTSFGDNLDITDRTARDTARKLWGPLSQDIQDGLTAQGKQDAAQAFRAADQKYAAHKDKMDDIVGPLLGKDGDAGTESVGKRLMSQLNNDSGQFSRTMSALSPDMAGNTRGAILKQLGTDGEQFSPSKFAKAWSKLSGDAQDALVPAGTQARQDVEDVTRLVQGVDEKGKFNNHSNTSGALHRLQQVGHLFSGGAAWGTLGKSLAVEGAAGLALGSNRVARGLTVLGEKRPLTSTTLKSLSVLPREIGVLDRENKSDE